MKIISQRKEIKAAIAAGKCIVYGYLRAKDSGTAKSGTLYYVGIASHAKRPFVIHKRHGARSATNVPVPVDAANVRLLGVFNSREEAANCEIALIKQHGRKGLDENGILLNRTAGGEGATGRQLADASVEKIRASVSELAAYAAQQKYGIAADVWRGLSSRTKTTINTRFNAGVRGRALMFDQRTIKSADRYGIEWESWEALTASEKKQLKKRFQAGARDAELFAKGRLNRNNNRYGLTSDVWSALTVANKKTIYFRYSHGKRGAELLKGIAA